MKQDRVEKISKYESSKLKEDGQDFPKVRGMGEI
jgi:hypothetical protein